MSIVNKAKSDKWYRAFIICIVLALVIMAVLTACGYISHPKNDVADNSNEAYLWFVDTNIMVKSDNGRIYHIIQAPNGVLYYALSAEMAICPVYREDGTIMTDINEVIELF